MTIDELKVELDLNPYATIEVFNSINNAICIRKNRYLFIDDLTGACYLFNKNGMIDETTKLKIVGQFTFEFNDTLTTIILPDSIEKIEDYAFRNCTSLNRIEMPDTISCIEPSAFIGCISLKQIVFKNKTMDEIKKIRDFPWERYKSRIICKELTN